MVSGELPQEIVFLVDLGESALVFVTNVPPWLESDSLILLRLLRYGKRTASLPLDGHDEVRGSAEFVFQNLIFDVGIGERSQGLQQVRNGFDTLCRNALDGGYGRALSAIVVMLIDADQDKGKVIIEIVVANREDCLKDFVELFFGFLVFDIGTLA